MDSPQNVPREEIMSLNADDLDVQELERRLELATGFSDAGAAEGGCYIDGCDINVEFPNDSSA